MLAPGYLIAHVLNVSGFRAKALREQLAWSLTLSLGIGTILLIAGAWILGVTTTGYVLAAAGIAAIAVFLRNRPQNDFIPNERTKFIALAAGWTILVLLSLVDIGEGNHLWMSVTSYDHSVRVAFVGSVMRTGVPPINPLYWPGHAAPMRYYYFWYVISGIVAKLAHISARQAFIASCVWPFFGVIATLALFGRYLLQWRAEHLRRTLWLTIAFMAITGLDLICTLLGKLGGGSPPGDLEWWSVAQVSSWADTFLWTPHHAAALICALLTLLLLCVLAEQQASPYILAALAGLSFASCFGLSTYIAIATAILLTAWFLMRIFQPGPMKIIATAATMTLTSAIALTPYLIQMLGIGAPKQRGSAGSTHILAFGIREMLPPKMLLGISALHHIAVQNPWHAEQISAAFLLIPGYFIELGFFAVILIAACRRGTLQSKSEKQLLAATFITLGITTFLRSTVLTTNDFSVRASLLPQFGLLLLAAIVWERRTLSRKKLLLTCATIGLFGTVYQVAMLRCWIPWHETHGDPTVAGLSERNLALRATFGQLDPKISQNARIQFAQSTGYYSDAAELNANRQIVNAEHGCNSSFGGETSACPAIQHAVDQLYPQVSASTPTATEAIALCQNIGAQYLIATRWDPVWSASKAWPWQLPVVLANDHARVLACAAEQR